MTLKRSISTIGLLFSAVGSIVGSGWLFGPFFAAKIAGPAAVFAWLLGGSLMMVVALTFAELASAFPLTGGTVRFLQMSHGSFVGYTMAWIGWISAAAVAPIETMALLAYASNYWPALMHNMGGVNVLTTTGIMVAASLMLLMCTINVIGIRFFTKTMNAIVSFKLAIPIITICVLLTTSFHSHNFTSHQFAPMGWHNVFACLAGAGVIFSFIGYAPAIQLAGEAKNPQRAVPIAIIGALCITIVLYVALQIAFIGAVNPQSLTHGWQHLSFVGDTGPFAGMMLGLGLIWFVKVLFIDAAVSPFGSALIYTASTARMAYAMGENGYLPPWLLKLNQQKMPYRIIGMNFLIGMVLFLPFPTWQGMVGFLVSALVFAYAVGPLSLLVLRRNLPDHPRPFRTPAAKLICPLAFYICNLIIFWTGWHTIAKMLITIIIGYGVLAYYQRSEAGKQLNINMSRSWWLLVYLSLTGIVSYCGSFGGGHNIIPFGWDFAAIATVTAITFALSQYYSEPHTDPIDMTSIQVKQDTPEAIPQTQPI